MKFPEPKGMPCRDLDQLYPVVKAKAIKLVDLCKKAGIPITITQTYRSSQYQQELYNQGRTAKGDIVTNCKPGSSPHEHRVAFDFCMAVKGHTWDIEMMEKVWKIAESIDLECGGKWKEFKDPPHIQYLGGYTMREIKLGKIPA